MIFSNHFVNAQDSIVNTNPIDYTQPKDYILADISIKGIKFLSKSTITDISALKINQIRSKISERIGTELVFFLC